MEIWEKALDDLVKISVGQYDTQKKEFCFFCFKIDPRLENRRECLMLKHKKGKAAPYRSKKAALPYLKETVYRDDLTENGKKLFDALTAKDKEIGQFNRDRLYITNTIKGDECLITHQIGEGYSYRAGDFVFRTQICIGTTGTEFINQCAEMLENKGRDEKQAWVDRAKRIANKNSDSF